MLSKMDWLQIYLALLINFCHFDPSCILHYSTSTTLLHICTTGENIRVEFDYRADRPAVGPLGALGAMGAPAGSLLARLENESVLPPLTSCTDTYN